MQVAAPFRSIVDQAKNWPIPVYLPSLLEAKDFENKPIRFFVTAESYFGPKGYQIRLGDRPDCSGVVCSLGVISAGIGSPPTGGEEIELSHNTRATYFEGEGNCHNTLIFIKNGLMYTFALPGSKETLIQIVESALQLGPFPVASCPDLFDLRKTTWGMTKEQVKASEELKPWGEEDDMIFYRSELAGRSCALAYRFVDDKLVSGSYVFNHTHTNQSDFFTDFDTMRDLLTEKYGKPKWGDTTWKNSLYRNEPEYRGLALGMGHITKTAGWSTPSTDISMRLTGDNYKVQFGIGYIGKRFEDLAERAHNKKSKDKL
jgi:hypothetical protein